MADGPACFSPFIIELQRAPLHAVHYRLWHDTVPPHNHPAQRPQRPLSSAPAPPKTHSPLFLGLAASPSSVDFAAARRYLDLAARRVMAPSSCSSSYSSLSSGGSHAGLAIAATAMALSGTLVLYSLCRAKQPHLQMVPSDSVDAPSPRLRPCLASSEKRKKKKRDMARRGGSQKRVRFADDVVDKDNNGAASAAAAPREAAEAEPSCAAALRRTPMPANREALYRGMLRDRSMLRATCSY